MEEYNLRVPDISNDQVEKWVDEMTKRMGPFLEQGERSLRPMPQRPTPRMDIPLTPEDSREETPEQQYQRLRNIYHPGGRD